MAKNKPVFALDKGKLLLVKPCRVHDWIRTAVFYASEEQTCLNCGAKRTYKRENI